MRDPIENVTRLQKQLNNLQLENQVLKNILDKAGLSYQNELASIRKKDTKEDFDPEQGKRIVYPKEITDRMAKLFFSFFWGRTDVYAKRNVNKNGEAAYYPQCDNFWSDNCHRKLNTHIDCKDCKYCSYTRLDLSTILTHLRGNSYVAKDVIGVYPLFSDGTCRFLVFDFDNHEKNAEKRDFANTDDTWIEEVEAMRDICTLNGIEPLVERSRSGKGAHIWIFFDKPISAAVVRKFGLALLDKGAEQVNLKSFNYYDRMLPAQDSLENVAIGNLIALPLQGRALKDGNSAFVDGNWNAYPDQWNALLSKALKELTKHDNGILHAATAFGKTVVCSAVIAEKKVNTLILLESSALIEQWKDALNKFLIIDEELPQYKTKTGRLRTRKSLIGTLQGVHDSMTGIVDIAMVGSLCKKGEFHNLLNDYGLVIIDECHHSASETIANVLKEVKARYVYGVTATPKRGDGLEKINYMLIGPIRYSYTAKEKAMEQGIQHLVYPRFTRTVPPRGVLIGKMHPNEAYEIIHNNDIRDEQIVEDVKNCVSAGRTPVVLSRYKDHSEKLYERLKDYADHVFLMTGNNSKKEHKKILEQMHQVYKAESLILIATGSLVGEGFDFPRLDTLFMATPVSFRGVVEQYAGRLNRDYAGKENVIIYDYVDNHITMFNNMYMKRLKAYKQIGYEIAGGLHNDKQTANAIYDGDNYAENYHKDLLDANKNIIISSPAISGTKVYELINLLKEKQLSGVQITIVTWAPDSYGFGDASYWMQLHEEMRKAGFYIKTVEESCERFAVIDQEVVWYGNINLLAKDKVDDSIMRVLSKEIASELMEITFGDNG